MPAQRYTITPFTVETLLNWVKSGDIAVPEIQRPFVWTPKRVRDFLDSLYRGYPVGNLVIWRNIAIPSKDGAISGGRRILIDGQQRVTALKAALLGEKVTTKDYKERRIRIAFNPIEEKFEVYTPTLSQMSTWIPDISQIFLENSLFALLKAYLSRNQNVNEEEVSKAIENLRSILANQIGVIELDSTMDLEVVTEIFIRINSKGVPLSQADFVMALLASIPEKGSLLRNAIDYFAHLIQSPSDIKNIEKKDQKTVHSEYWQALQWISEARDLLYQPSYRDILRVAFMTEVERVRFPELMALLSGRNFETRSYEPQIAEKTFQQLSDGVLAFVKETHFERFQMILKSAGFIDPDLASSKNALNFAYTLYLYGRKKGIAASELERLVRMWYVLSLLTTRYSGSSDTQLENDFREMRGKGPKELIEITVNSEVNENFWSVQLPRKLNTSKKKSPYFACFLAAQVHAKDKGFLSKEILVQDILQHQGDIHHIFPKKYLVSIGVRSTPKQNQLANLVVAQTEINIAIGKRAPEVYFTELMKQVSGGKKYYGGITDLIALKENLEMHCIPLDMLNGKKLSYEEFLEERRKLMAQKIRRWFEALSRS